MKVSHRISSKHRNIELPVTSSHLKEFTRFIDQTGLFTFLWMIHAVPVCNIAVANNDAHIKPNILFYFALIGVAVKSTLDNTSTVQYAGLMGQLADKARSVVRDLDPSNDLTFLRIRSKKHEIMIAPDKDFIMIVIQNPTD